MWWDAVKAALKALGEVVDKIVPGPVGARTAVLVTVCTVAPAVAAAIPAAASAVPLIQMACHWLAPVTAAAGVARKL